MTHKELILDFIKKNTTLDKLLAELKSKNSIGISALDIEKEFDIVRNNSSSILNELYKENYLIKINSRPVTFIYKDHLLHLNSSENFFKLDDIKSSLLKAANTKQASDPFEELIGHNGSLATNITKAKAAILYPPKGLNTLILGESGVGKTTFANAMYQFAKLSKSPNKDIPFIAFNCSDYYNNPHLLLSQLFGHVKGAFTGADSDKEGLVEKANDGILFLDEIHRLPPDGQEMLFYLMDNGQFNRLGETSKNRKSNVIIIAATTENPDDVLLNTFLRRIPVTLKLPSFNEKTIDERIDIVENIFFQEYTNLNVPISIPVEVLKAICLYDFKKGNLGQLYSEIKLLCAKAFLNYMKQKADNIKITFDMLSKDIIYHYSFLDKSSKDFFSFDKDTIVIDSNSAHRNITSKIYTTLSDNIYETISNKVSTLKESGLVDEDIDKELSEIINIHYNSLINKFSEKNITTEFFNKIIDNAIVSFSSELINYASVELEISFTNQFILILSLHIQSLIKRLKNGVYTKKLNLEKLKEKYPREFEVATYFLHSISSRFNLAVPEDEKGFLTLLLTNNQVKLTHSHIGIIVMCHGDSTASSMSKVANTLLGSNLVRAIDMPLDVKNDIVYKRALTIIKSMDNTNEILLLCDMGSLTDMGNILAEETKKEIRTIANVSTLMVLESLRQVLLKTYNLNEIYSNLLSTFNNTPNNINKKNCIITICATGQGSSLLAKNMLEDMILSNDKLSKIEIIAIDFDNHVDKINNLKQEYNILACVGNLRPQMNISFFSLNQLFAKNFKYDFVQFLESKLGKSEQATTSSENKEESPYETAEKVLSKYIRFINPAFAVKSIKKFIEALNSDKITEVNTLDLILHIGCMLDRAVRGYLAKFDNKESFITNFSTDFSNIKNSIPILEKDFDLNITDDEICFMIKVLNRDKFNKSN